MFDFHHFHQNLLQTLKINEFGQFFVCCSGDSFSVFYKVLLLFVFKQSVHIRHFVSKVNKTPFLYVEYPCQNEPRCFLVQNRQPFVVVEVTLLVLRFPDSLKNKGFLCGMCLICLTSP